MKIPPLLIALTVTSIVLAACGGVGEPSTIKVGLVAELTGDMPAVGASCKNAAEMAVKEANDAGGLDVGGRKYKIELFVQDNAGQADQSASATQKLITQQKVVAIIGPNVTRCAIPASEIAESSQVTLISPWSTNPKTTLAKTGAPQKYVFRACLIDPFQGRVVARFVMDKLKAKKAAVLYDVASDYNKGIAELFIKTFELSGGQVVSETYTTGDKDWTAQLTKIKSATPDVIFLPNYYSEALLQIQQAKQMGIVTPFVGSDSWGSEELIKLCGRDCEGYFLSAHYAADIPTPVARKFAAGYKAMYESVPDDVAALTYDALGLLWQALKDAGKVDRRAVRDALARISRYEGVTGNIQFQEGSGDPIKSVVILQIKNGKFVWVTNADP